MAKQSLIELARKLQAISQNGLAYLDGNIFDAERYEQIREIAAELLALTSNLEKADLVESFKLENGYATPKVDIRGVVFRDDKILLVKEISDGKWTLPGGWADVNESPKESVAREIKEESGYDVVPVKLLAVYDKSKHPHPQQFVFHVYKMFILCELTGGEAIISNETSAIDFFGENELPELSTGRVTESQIKKMFEHFHNPQLEIELD